MGRWSLPSRSTSRWGTGRDAWAARQVLEARARHHNQGTRPFTEAFTLRDGSHLDKMGVSSSASIHRYSVQPPIEGAIDNMKRALNRAVFAHPSRPLAY